MRDAGAVRDLSRLHEISLTFIRHGLGDLVRRLGVASLLERAGEVLLWTEVARSAQLLVLNTHILDFLERRLGEQIVLLNE